MSNKILLKLAKRFEAMGEVHSDIVEELKTSKPRGKRKSIDRHGIMADIFQECAKQIRGAMADTRNNL